MKKITVKVVLSVFALLTLLSITPLVVADNKVAASMTAGPVSKVVAMERSITPAGTAQVTVEYDLSNNHLTIGSTTYVFYSYNIFDMNYNPVSQTLIIHSDAIWYVGSPTAPTNDGFAGNIETKQYGMPSFPPATTYTSTTTHCALQGFGAFEGQTLILSFEGTTNGAWTGFVIEH
jgi:hypothetical protein